MNKEDCNDRDALVASYLADDPDFAKHLVEQALNIVLEGEMTELLGCEKGERSASRRGYRSGHYTRKLTMKVGTIELRVPQDRDGCFSTRVFERYRRSEKALMSTLAEMYVQGVSTRKVTKLAEGLCGHDFSHTTISNMVAELDEALEAFATRRLDDSKFPYLVLDARYEKVREAGAVRSRAVQLAVGIDQAGQRHLLAVEVADKESENSWETFLKRLKERGLTGVEYVVSDSHEGLKRASEKVLTTALWQRCAVHFLRNADDHAHHQTDPACLADLKRMWSCTDMAHAKHELGIWVRRWSDAPGCDQLETVNSLSSGSKSTSRRRYPCTGCRVPIASA